MNRIIFVCLTIFFFSSCKIQLSDYECIDMNGRKCDLNYTTNIMYVGFSSLGCHDCHVKLNEYFETKGYYNNDTIKIYGIIALEEDEIRNELMQQLNIASMKRYYPNMNEFRFCIEKDNSIKIIGNTIRNFNTPFLIEVKNKEFRYIPTDSIFSQNGMNVIIN
ncbi:MAG: hypothetical protein IKV46_04015 [Bacteroidales bacterium]|nr:hypothetical protein [Bacteroidales bacterium]